MKSLINSLNSAVVVVVEEAGPTYIATNAENTGLLDLPFSLSFTVGNVMEGSVTTWAG
jgi:hypothetical protein